jgi:flagellum-specific ATP synthase
VRSLLDGHVILDRNLAMRNHYPPISLLESLSRLMPQITTEEHMEKAKALRLLLAAYIRSEDLIRIGAYQKGSDPTLDRAVEVLPKLNAFLHQHPDEIMPFSTVIKTLFELPS